MSSVNSLSFAVPGAVKPGELYRLPDTPRYVIPEVEARRAGLNDEQINDVNREQQFSEVAAWSSAGNALATLYDGLQKVDRVISIVEPSLSEKTWDFALDDGKLVAQGDLSDNEKELVENFLNAMPGMTEAAQALEKAAVNALDVNGNGSSPAFRVNGYTNRYAMSYYKDVAGQLDGKLNLRHLLQETERHVTNGGKYVVSDATGWGMGAAQVIESYLTASKPIIDPPAQPFQTT